MIRDGSGTSWLPDATPMYAFHWQRGDWQVMLHENAFLQFLDESGDRGSDQLGSINWMMGMAQRTVGRGRMMVPWNVQRGTVDGRRLWVSGLARERRAVQWRGDSRSAASPRSDDGALGPVRRAARPDRFAGRCTAGRLASRRWGLWPIRIASPRSPIRSRQSPITGWIRHTSRSVC